MNCLSHVRVYGSALFRNAGNFIATTSLNQCHVPLLKRSFRNAGVKTVDLEFVLTRFRTHDYSSRTSDSSRKKASRIKKVEPESSDSSIIKASRTKNVEPESSDSSRKKPSRTKKVQPEQPVMENEKNTFSVARKGDVVGSRAKNVEPEQPVRENEKDTFSVARKGDVVGSRTKNVEPEQPVMENETNTFSVARKGDVVGFRTKKVEPEQPVMENETSTFSVARKGDVVGSRTKKVEPEQPVMENETNTFFVVRKGDVVGVFKSFADCQAQVGSLICDLPVSVYKGYSLTKETKTYLSSCGLKNALYTIKASDVKEDLFAALIPCPFQEPAPSNGETSNDDATKKRPHDMLQSEYGGLGSLGSIAVADPVRKHVKLDPHAEVQMASSGYQSCIIEFDGASKGNPGPAGAAAVLKTEAGNVICKLREGLGIATNNAAEYRALILGLKYALRKGYTNIRVRGDSKLICKQLQGLWEVKHEHMAELHGEAKKLKDKFRSFQINHVLRGLNGDADAEANLAVKLAEGQFQEELV